MSFSNFSSIHRFVVSKNNSPVSTLSSSQIANTVTLSSSSYGYPNSYGSFHGNGSYPIAISKNGQSIAYVTLSTSTVGAKLYTNTNYGIGGFSLIYTFSTTLNFMQCCKIQISNNGNYVMMLQNVGGESKLYVLNVSTSTLTSVGGLIGSGNMRDISMSSSGQYQLVNDYNGRIHVSNNYGINWTLIINTVGNTSNYNVQNVAISSNGQYLFVLVESGSTNGQIIAFYYGSRSGTTWTVNLYTLNTTLVTPIYGKCVYLSDNANKCVVSYHTGNVVVITGLLNISTVTPTVVNMSSTIRSIIGNYVLSSPTFLINSDGSTIYFMNSAGKIQKSTDNLQTYSQVSNTVVSTYTQPSGSSGVTPSGPYWLYGSVNCKYILTFSGNPVNNTGILYLTTDSSISEIS